MKINSIKRIGIIVIVVVICCVFGIISATAVHAPMTSVPTQLTTTTTTETTVEVTTFAVATQSPTTIPSTTEKETEPPVVEEYIEEVEEYVEEPTEEVIEYADVPSYEDASYSPSDLEFQGILYWGGWRWTWYSEQVLPGGGLDIPGRHTEADTGFVCDENGYICLASGSLDKGTIVDTPFGRLGKVYDCGCASDVLDVYVNW